MFVYLVWAALDLDLELDINIGGYDDDFSDDVLKFDITSQSWIQVGSLQEARYQRAMSVVNQEEIINYCI